MKPRKSGAVRFRTLAVCLSLCFLFSHFGSSASFCGVIQPSVDHRQVQPERQSAGRPEDRPNPSMLYQHPEASKVNDLEPAVSGTTTDLSTESAIAGTWNENGWNSNGPLGGWVQSLAIAPSDPARIWLTSMVPFKSNSGGTQWERLAAVSTANEFNIAIDPLNADRVYLWGHNYWVWPWFTTNAGQTWNRLQCEPGTKPRFFLVLPGSVNYLGEDDRDHQYENRVFRSTDDGLTWSRGGKIEYQNYPLPGMLFASPANPAIMYVTVPIQGVYKSTDGGTSWKSLGGGLDTSQDGHLVIAPSNPSVLYLRHPGGVFKSTDGGTGWIKLTSDSFHSSNFEPLVVDPRNANIIYSGNDEWDIDHYTRYRLVKSTDGGVSWAGAGVMYPYTCINALAIDSSSTLYAGTNRGVFRSFDGGTSWTEINQGFNEGNFSKVIADPADSRIVFAAGTSGLFKSTDAGQSWSRKNDNLYSRGGLAIDPADHKVIYSAGASDSSRCTLQRSTDGGDNWTEVYIVGDFTAEGILVDPADSSTLFFTVSQGGNCIARRVLKSTNGGLTWDSLPITECFPSPVALDPLQSNAVYWHFKSTDGGDNWSARVSSENIYAIDFDPGRRSSDPKSPSTVFYANKEGITESTDGGMTWNAKHYSGGVWSFLIDPADPAIMYMGKVISYTTGQFYRSLDGGNTWESTGWDDRFGYPLSITLSTLDPDLVHVGTKFGVFSCRLAPASPVIDMHPADQKTGSGERASLEIRATGGSPLHYVWYQGESGDTRLIASGGTDSAMYHPPPLQRTTRFWCQVINPFGFANSQAATVTLTCQPVIGAHPRGATITAGQTATLTVTATSTLPLRYQWYQGESPATDKPVAGAIAPSYTTPALTTTTRYWVQVSNDCGPVNSNTALVAVYNRLANYTIGGFLGAGTGSPQRAIHVQGANAVFRMDRSQDTAAFMIVRNKPDGGLLKAYLVGANASAKNNGGFVVNDLGAATTGSGTNRLTVDNSGAAQFGGVVRATGFVQNSSRLLKRNIQPLRDALPLVLRLQGFRFNWRATGAAAAGLLADLTAPVAPLLVNQTAGGVYGIDYGRLTVLLLEGMKTQQDRLQALQEKRERLERQLQELEGKLSPDGRK